jgi:hypothetical protein
MNEMSAPFIQLSNTTNSEIKNTFTAKNIVQNVHCGTAQPLPLCGLFMVCEVDCAAGSAEGGALANADGAPSAGARR